MLIVDNLEKAWNTGQYLGDMVLGNLSAIPGYILDGIINASLSKENRYDFTNISLSEHDGVGHLTFSNAFAVPGKLIGNAIIPLAFTAIAAALIAPNMVIRFIDKSYQLVKEKIDALATFLAQESGRLHEATPNYFDKIYLSGEVLLGNLVGAITSLIGVVFDGLLAMIGINTGNAFTSMTFTAGYEFFGFLGGGISAVIGMILYPVKVILDSVFNAYRGFRDILDKIAAFCTKNNGVTADKKIDPTGARIFSEKFRNKMTHVNTQQLTAFGLFKWLCCSGQENGQRASPALRQR